MDGLRVSCGMLEAVAIVRPVGLLDVASYPVLRDALLKQAADVPDGIVVDLAELIANQVTSLSVFPTVWLQITSWPDIALVLAAPREPLATLLAGSAVPRFVPVHDSVASACDAVMTEQPRRRRAHHDAPLRAGTVDEYREWARVTLTSWGVAAIEEALVVVGELVANVAAHAVSTRLRLRLELRASGLSIAVQDQDATPPTFSGRGHVGGIGIVDALARIWGHNPAPPAGKVVWAVMHPAGSSAVPGR